MAVLILSFLFTAKNANKNKSLVVPREPEPHRQQRLSKILTSFRALCKAYVFCGCDSNLRTTRQ